MSAATPHYWRLIGSGFLFLLGIYGIQAFAQYFVRDTLQTDNPVKLTGDLMATIVLAADRFLLPGRLPCATDSAASPCTSPPPSS